MRSVICNPPPAAGPDPKELRAGAVGSCAECFLPMRITTQLCAALPVSCAVLSHLPQRPSLTDPTLSKPHKSASDRISRRFFLIPDRGPLGRMGVAVAGVEACNFPCPGAGGLAPFSGFPGLPAVRRRRARNFPAQPASLFSLRLIDLAKRRLECKKKMKGRTPPNRLRAGGRRQTGAVRDGRVEPGETSDTAAASLRFGTARNTELAWELLAWRLRT